PRPDFKVARFNDGVEDIRDLKEGMLLEGTVSNVAAFGAFVDIGVHQDGLVHVSQLADKFVTDAREVVKTGDIVKVRVTEVDVARKRIGLTMKLGAAPARRDAAQGARENRFESARTGPQNRGVSRQGAPQPASATAMESAFGKLAALKK
ncbi:MAG: S1 RNA-binding domain-containing protein, partial [Polaromonas sp.]